MLLVALCPCFVQCDDDFSLGVSCFKIPERFSSRMQWVTSIDHRRDAPGLKQLLHEHQILLRWVLHKRAEPLPTLLGAPWPDHHGFEKPTARTADQDIYALGCQRALVLGERAIGR